MKKLDEKENIHPNFSNQVGNGESLNEQGPSDDTKDAEDCLTTEEATEGHLKKISLQTTDKTRYDPLIFLKTREDEIKSISAERARQKNTNENLPHSTGSLN